jgi:uncharacterized protein (UPF0335 family)
MDDAAFNTESVAADQLKTFIERIERLEEEKAGIAGDIKDVYAEAKGNGFDTKVLRKIVSLRKKDHSERMEEEAVLELYMQALGMVA